MTEWSEPPGELRLPAGAVHVWHTSLSVPARRLDLLRATLSHEEIERARRFRFALHRDRFIVSRGLLRVLLGRYLDLPPRQVPVIHTLRGKPALAAPMPDLSFNLAHSGDTVLYAFTRGRAIGVDVERIRSGLSTDRIAARFFSAREAAELRALPPEERQKAFFRCWTRKEAILKAIGQGLAIGLDRFTVTLVPGQPARIVDSPPDFPDAARWSLHDLDGVAGCAAAVAVLGPIDELCCWRSPAGSVPDGPVRPSGYNSQTRD